MSINFITAHDGFTLAYLVSYNEKHNEVDGKNNDPQILALREQQKRNFLTTLMLSQEVPMILGEDKMGRTQ